MYARQAGVVRARPSSWRDSTPVIGPGRIFLQAGVARGLATCAATHWKDGGMAETVWHQVTDAAGAVFGWMAEPDPDERPDDDYWSADCRAWLDLRCEVLALMLDEAFDVADVWESGIRAGLSEDDMDSIGNVALCLQRVEYLNG
jgi:hypothetical protein